MLYAFGTKFEIRTCSDEAYSEPIMPDSLRCYLHHVPHRNWDIRVAGPAK